MENFLFPVIKVKVIKVIKHFPLALFSYSIILNIFNIILYIFRSPRILNDLNDHDLNDPNRLRIKRCFLTENHLTNH